jgi:hypothetical protein
MKGKRIRKGQSLVEFALILPILLIVLMGLLDLGRLYFAYVAVTDAAGEGAAYAAIYPEDNAGIVARAQDASGGLIEIDENLIEITPPPAIQSGAPIAVSVAYNFTLLTPLISGMVPEGVLVLHAVATETILSGEL